MHNARSMFAGRVSFSGRSCFFASADCEFPHPPTHTYHPSPSPVGVVGLQISLGHVTQMLQFCTSPGRGSRGPNLARPCNANDTILHAKNKIGRASRARNVYPLPLVAFFMILVFSAVLPIGYLGYYGSSYKHGQWKSHFFRRDVAPSPPTSPSPPVQCWNIIFEQN